ncbi:MAG: class III extradiol ring-cleavage dioxygenase, partial [Thermoplasmata archaeon]
RVGDSFSLHKPSAALVISAHWITEGTFVQASAHPAQIYDFQGYDDVLYKVKYTPKGNPVLAQRVAHLLSEADARTTEDWGIDHGVYSILRHIWPDADVPVVVLSIAIDRPPEYHYLLGKMLRPLRSEGVIVIASGNIVNNYREADFSVSRINGPEEKEWAREFQNEVALHLRWKDYEMLLHPQDFGEIGKMSVPSEEHYYPMHYINGIAETDDGLEILYTGIHHGTIGMLSWRIG